MAPRTEKLCGQANNITGLQQDTAGITNDRPSGIVAVTLSRESWRATSLTLLLRRPRRPLRVEQLLALRSAVSAYWSTSPNDHQKYLMCCSLMTRTSTWADSALPVSRLTMSVSDLLRRIPGSPEPCYKGWARMWFHLE